MFNKYRLIEEYKKLADDVKIPEIGGEEYIKTSTNNIKKRFNATKKIGVILASSIILVLCFNFYLKITKDNYTIKAYAGTNTIDLENGEMIELPSGWVDKSTYNMQGLLIESDDIEKITFDRANSGNIEYVRTNSDHAEKQLICVSPNFNTSISIPSESSGMIAAKFTTDEVVNKLYSAPFIVRNFNEGSEIRKNLGLSFEEIEETFNKYDGDSREKSTSIINDDNNEIYNDKHYTKHYILWVPNEMLLKDIVEGKDIDYSSIESTRIKFTITFKDKKEITKELELSFNSHGNLSCQLS